MKIVHIVGMDEYGEVEERIVRGGKAKEPKAKCMLMFLGTMTGVKQKRTGTWRVVCSD